MLREILLFVFIAVDLYLYLSSSGLYFIKQLWRVSLQSWKITWTEYNLQNIFGNTHADIFKGGLLTMLTHPRGEKNIMFTHYLGVFLWNKSVFMRIGSPSCFLRYQIFWSGLVILLDQIRWMGFLSGWWCPLTMAFTIMKSEKPGNSPDSIVPTLRRHH